MGTTCSCLTSKEKPNSNVIVDDIQEEEVKSNHNNSEKNISLHFIEKKTPRGTNNPSQSKKMHSNNSNSMNHSIIM